MVSKKILLAATILLINLLSTFAYAGQDDLSLENNLSNPPLPPFSKGGMVGLFSSFLALPIEGDPYRVWFDKGKILYSQMAYKEAFDAFKKIDKNAPPDILDESSYLSANCLMETGYYDDAASFTNAVSNKSRFYPFALYTRAMISLKTGNEKIATDYLEDVIKYVRTAQPSKGKQTGEKEGILNEIEKLAQRANLTLGFINLEKDNYEEALKYLSEVPKDSPFHDKALFGLGWTYARMGRWVRSVVVWEELYSLYPDSPYSIEVVPYIGYAYTRLNAYGKAIEQNGIALRYYKDLSAKITGLKSGIQHGDIEKIASAVNTYGDKEMSASLKLYKGLLHMEEFLGQLSPGGSPEAESLINSSKKMREDILDDVYSKVQVYLEKLQRQLLEASIDTSIGMAQNLRLEGGGQISSDMTFIDHD